MDKNFAGIDLGSSNLVELLQLRASQQPSQNGYTFLVDGEMLEASLTFRELDEKARVIAASLQKRGLSGQRIMLLYPSGLEFIVALFGCLYAGAVPVLVHPPQPNRPLVSFQSTASDAQAMAALTAPQIFAGMQSHLEQFPDLKKLQWLTVDDLVRESSVMDWKAPTLTGDSLAFLVYTSGSTNSPKGVMLSHGNLLHNSLAITRGFNLGSESRAVSWFPLYHVSGLVSSIIYPLYLGCQVILMSPLSFVERPVRWLKAITRYQANVSAAPNFGFQFCLDRIASEDRATLDLSSWKVAYNASEPVRAETLDRFYAVFAPCGFKRESLIPAYGLSEATLFVSGLTSRDQPTVRWIRRSALEHNQVILVDAGDESGQTFVGCGQAIADTKIIIVDPETLMPCPPDRVGEIWVGGPGVALGYWNRPDETQATFCAKMAETGVGPFLRTGDLGFMLEGELFITGRIKDLIILRGRNYYSQDIEATAVSSHAALLPGGGAAFSIARTGEEHIVLMHEVKPGFPNLDVDEVSQAIRHAIARDQELPVYAVVLVKPGSLPRTPSGKIQRYLCRAEFLARQG